MAILAILAMSANAWLSEHIYTSTGNRSDYVYATYTGRHWVGVQAPTVGNVYSRLYDINNQGFEVLRAWTFASGGKKNCSYGTLHTGDRGDKHTSEATVNSGTAYAWAWDKDEAVPPLICPNPEEE